MSSNTLDALGRAILETLEEETVTFDTLEATFDTSQETLESHLAQLIDNALVRKVNGDEYELTDNGRRLLRATPFGARDNRIDIPPPVERSIEGLSLTPDEAQAVRTAFSFLAYWGNATTAELVDGCYSESPAGYETPEQWWATCLEDSLRELPLVTPPDPDATVSSAPSSQPNSSASDECSAPIAELWMYERTPVIERLEDEDGRDAPESDPEPFGSVRHGLENRTESDAERTAARVAFGVLFDQGTATAFELAERVYADYPAEYDSSDAWVAWLSDVFDDLPGIERDEKTDAEIGWKYESALESDGLGE
ncbi:hypothetical protein HALLA_21190 (plasmid) [Halostagnicola larsenii XH-48]|uniref:Uncharacterized protein n=1 Tax=Halostagnicola larsenii XH-48 TaxID=797299 RepID=W0JZQ3_9EURY|nr:hypothetical protein [Halostagnicola larsenii]AHG02423.1 hypothetical protein HALLA_21190 [Halostagnicola larsenii XH-48]